MLKFYHNPKTGDLIIFDQTDSEILIIEPIKLVRVVTVKDISVGDLRKQTLIGSDEPKIHVPKEKKKKRKRAIITPEMELSIKESVEIGGLNAGSIAKAFGISYAAADRRVKQIKKQKQNGGSIGQNLNNEDQERGNGSI